MRNKQQNSDDVMVNATQFATCFSDGARVEVDELAVDDVLEERSGDELDQRRR